MTHHCAITLWKKTNFCDFSCVAIFVQKCQEIVKPHNHEMRFVWLFVGCTLMHKPCKLSTNDKLLYQWHNMNIKQKSKWCKWDISKLNLEWIFPLHFCWNIQHSNLCDAKEDFATQFEAFFFICIVCIVLPPVHVCSHAWAHMLHFAAHCFEEPRKIGEFWIWNCFANKKIIKMIVFGDKFKQDETFKFWKAQVTKQTNAKWVVQICLKCATINTCTQVCQFCNFKTIQIWHSWHLHV